MPGLMSGRKPKPLEQQIAEGDPRKRGRRKLQERLNGEPKPARGLPQCPKHLRGRARAAWNFLRKELEGMKLDRRPDCFALEALCVAYDRAVAADLEVIRDGITIVVPIVRNKIIAEIKKPHPAITVSRVAWTQFGRYADRFGLSPAARARLQTEAAAEAASDAELWRLLRQPRRARPEPESMR